MRVLVITDWPALEAGTERAVEVMIEAFRERGDEARLLTTSAGSSAGGAADYVAYGTSAVALQAGLQVVNPHAVATVRRAVRDFRPDVVHLNMFLNHLSPAILTVLKHVQTVLVVHDYKATCPNQTRMRRDGSACDARAGAICREGGCVSLARWTRDLPRYGLLHRGLRHVDHVAAISRTVQRELMREGIVAGVVPEPVRPPEPGFERRPASAPTFMYGGRLAAVKGVDVLLRAFARVQSAHPGARLEIYGDGPDHEPLQRLASELRLDDGEALSFRFGMSPGWTSELSRAWALVAPSTFREPFGIVAVEAISRGVPVIATGPDSGFGETVEPGVSGTLVAPGSVDELAAAMLAVADAGTAPTVPADVVAAVRERHAPAHHVAAVLALLGEPVGAPAVMAAAR